MHRYRHVLQAWSGAAADQAKAGDDEAEQGQGGPFWRGDAAYFHLKRAGAAAVGGGDITCIPKLTGHAGPVGIRIIEPVPGTAPPEDLYPIACVREEGHRSREADIEIASCRAQLAGVKLPPSWAIA